MRDETFVESEDLGECLFVSTTRGIKIEVWPRFDELNSQPENSFYLYSYQIKISNGSPEILQLITRYWKITDGFNRTEEVRGEGVVGQKPVIPPGENFRYSSFCPLKTPTGKMKGSFQMKDRHNNVFDVEIAEFDLKCEWMIN